MSCTKDDDCHADKGKCIAGMCNCDGFYVGNGVQCRGGMNRIFTFTILKLRPKKELKCWHLY